MPSMPSTTNVGSAAKISGPDIINCNYNLYSQGERDTTGRQAEKDLGGTKDTRPACVLHLDAAADLEKYELSMF